MRRLLEQAYDRLTLADDTVCLERARLVTEAWQAHEHEPLPLRRALALRHVLQHMTLDLESNPLMAGNTSSRPRAWMLVPEHGLQVDAQVAIEHENLRGHLDGQVPDDIRKYWSGRSFGATGGGASGIGHLAIDLERVVGEGLAAIAAKVEASTAGDPVYRQAQVIALRAVIAWSHRYAEAAEARASAAEDLEEADALQRVASACRHVPANPARSLFEGLQAMALAHLATVIEGHGMSVSLGLPDRALGHFANEARADPARAVHDCSAFLLKVAANSFLGRGSKTQAVTVGGCDAAGEDQCNAITLAFLDAFDGTAVADPHLFLRWHGRLNEAVRERAAAMLSRGRSMPLLVGDKATIQGLIRHGVSPEDASEYCIIGCNELGIPGRACQSGCGCGGGINYLELLSSVIADGPADLGELWRRLDAKLCEQVRRGVERGETSLRRMAESVPTPLTSALMRSSESRGVDLMMKMPYRHRGFFERGLSNACNALAALEATQHDVPLSDVALAMERNWHGAEALRERLASCPAWGNDDDRADVWAQRLLDLRTRVLRETEAATGCPPLLACHVVRSLHHVDGRRIGATPDGRRAGEPVADSIGGVTGTMQEGPTAMLNSVLKVDAARHYPGGTNLNLTLPGGTASAAVVRCLIETFFADGGQELQVNVLDAARLREAQRDPQRHRDLIVRVAGLSARFVELSALEQAELIERAESAAGAAAAVSRSA